MRESARYVTVRSQNTRKLASHMRAKQVRMNQSNDWKNFLAAESLHQKEKAAHVARIKEERRLEAAAHKLTLTGKMSRAEEKRRQQEADLKRYHEEKFVNWARQAEYEPKNIEGSETLNRCLENVEPDSFNAKRKGRRRKLVRWEPATGTYELVPGVVVAKKSRGAGVSDEKDSELDPESVRYRPNKELNTSPKKELGGLLGGAGCGFRYTSGDRWEDAAKAEMIYGPPNRIYMVNEAERIRRDDALPSGRATALGEESLTLARTNPRNIAVPRFRRKAPGLNQLTSDQVNNIVDEAANNTVPSLSKTRRLQSRKERVRGVRSLPKLVQAAVSLDDGEEQPDWGGLEVKDTERPNRKSTYVLPDMSDTSSDEDEEFKDSRGTLTRQGYY
mmetsp:Transcript_1189/g.2860  ORF Transcript_1189/g.2860 Transcript_1189/m.2860 type:complete len:389 (-) Transcript_1189:131-1297(-)